MAKRSKKIQQPLTPETIDEIVGRHWSVKPEPVKPILPDLGLTKVSGLKTLYRSPFGGDGRFYFTLDDPMFYSGYSLWTHMVLPPSEGLNMWRASLGTELAEFISTSAKEYGHLLHFIISMHEDPGNDYRFSFTDPWWSGLAYEMARQAMLPRTEADKWVDQVNNDMAAYFAFKQEYDVKVLAVEVPLKVDAWAVATPGDMVAEMTVMVNDAPGKKKYPVRLVGGIDFKTGEKSVSYDRFRLQLEFMRTAWNQHFAGTDYEMRMVFNWRPSPRQRKPGGYILTNQDGYFTPEQVNHLGLTNKVMRYNVPGGGVTQYTDDGDEQYQAKVMRPLEWLNEWQQQMRINLKKRK